MQRDQKGDSGSVFLNIEPEKHLAPTEEEITRILFSAHDFQTSLSALTFLGEEYPEEIQRIELRRIRCFETTMVISYARPFSQSYLPLPRFCLNLISFTPSEDEASLHEELMALRNKRVAHSDFETMRMHSAVLDVEGLSFPHLAFDEGLHFSKERVGELESYLKRLLCHLARWVAEQAQANPTLLQRSINTKAGEGWPPKA